MDQKTKDRIAAEIAAEYRATIRQTAEAERSNRRDRPRAPKSIRRAYFFCSSSAVSARTVSIWATR